MRAAIALFGTLGLAALVGVIVLLNSSGGGEAPFDPAPEGCISTWNDDERAVLLGAHQFVGHGYTKVQVVKMSTDGAAIVPPTKPGALCAAIFPSPSLDPEASAAAMVQLPGGWRPLSLLQAAPRLTELQQGALDGYNAFLDMDGTIGAR